MVLKCFNILFFKFLILVWGLSPQVYGNTENCSVEIAEMFTTKVKLPRKINIPLENIERILKSGDGEYLLKASELFIVLENPQVIDQISYAFREHVYSYQPFRKRLFRKSYGANDLRAEILPLIGSDHEFNDDQLVAIWNILQALERNLDRGYLSYDQKVLLAVYLEKNLDKKNFLQAKIISRLNVGDLDSSLKERESHVIEAMVGNPKIKRVFEDLIKDLGFQNLYYRRYGIIEYYYDLNSSHYRSLLNSMSKKSFSFRKDNKSREVGALTLAFLKGAISAQDISFSSLYIKRGREWILQRLEETLLNELRDTTIVKSVVEYFDYFLFQVNLPLSKIELDSFVVAGANHYLMPIKSRASQLKSIESSKDFVPDENSNLFKVSEYIPVIEEVSKVNPNKRKNRVTKAEKTKELEGDDGRSQFVKEEYFPEGFIPREDEVYSFQFSRNPNLGLQSISFDDEVIHSMNLKASHEWGSFMKALTYGFTSTHGQNGVKSLVSAKGYYELKPGSSSYRIILSRKGDEWQAIGFVHKDKVQRYLDNL